MKTNKKESGYLKEKDIVVNDYLKGKITVTEVRHLLNKLTGKYLVAFYDK